MSRTAYIERLQALENAIKLSIGESEDYDGPADPLHLVEASRCGLPVDSRVSKGDLLSAVQLQIRAS